jgi:hypothetical protein
MIINNNNVNNLINRIVNISYDITGILIKPKNPILLITIDDVDEEDNNKIENYIKTFLKPVCNIVKIKSIERNQINLNYTNDLLHIEVEVDKWYNNDIKEIIIDKKKEYYFEENKMLISLL